MGCAAHSTTTGKRGHHKLINEELSLGEAHPVNTEESLGDPGEFDFATFLEGVRSRCKTVRVYARHDLEAQIDALRAKALDLMNAGRVSELAGVEKEMKQLADKHAKHALDIVLEERSRDWQARKVKELKAEGITGDHRLEIHLIAAHVVAPEGVDGALLEELAERAPGEMMRVAKAWAELHRVDGGQLDF